MKIFDSKKQSQKIEKNITNILNKSFFVKDKSMVIVQIGNDAPSSKFIDLKVKLSERLGIKCDVFKIDEKANSDEEIFNKVNDIFDDNSVVGGIVQLPFPRKSLYKLLDCIPVAKDIDVISTEGTKRFYSGDFSILSPVILSFQNFINENNIELKDTKAIVIGDGDLVGKPISFYLTKKGAKVEVLSNYNGVDRLVCRLLVLASGVPNLVQGENIPEGCDVVDFGSSVIDGKCVGDLNMTSSIGHLGCISKSPGGMGPLVVRYLFLNWVEKLLNEDSV